MGMNPDQKGETAGIKPNQTRETANKEGKFRILVVEDEAPVAKMLGVVVEGIDDASATFTETAEEGLELAKKAKEDGSPFSLILTDNRLKGNQNGFDLAAAVKKEKLLVGVTIWMISGRPSGKSPEELAAVGISKFVAKPFSTGQMMDDIAAERASQQRQGPAENRS